MFRVVRDTGGHTILEQGQQQHNCQYETYKVIMIRRCDKSVVFASKRTKELPFQATFGKVASQQKSRLYLKTSAQPQNFTRVRFTIHRDKMHEICISTRLQHKAALSTCGRGQRGPVHCSIYTPILQNRSPTSIRINNYLMSTGYIDMRLHKHAAPAQPGSYLKARLSGIQLLDDTHNSHLGSSDCSVHRLSHPRALPIAASTRHSVH